MKNNIDWYPHCVNSDEHPKLKMLRVKYGWEGEGKFWALNNRIAESEGCHINLTKLYNKSSLADHLNFTLKEFDEFLKYLEKDCSLIIRKNNYIFTKRVKEVWEKVMQKRETNKKSYKKSGKQDDDKGSKHRQTSEKKIQTSKKTQIKLDKIRSKKKLIKRKEIKKIKQQQNPNKEQANNDKFFNLFFLKTQLNRDKIPINIKLKLNKTIHRAENILTTEQYTAVLDRCLKKPPGQRYEYYLKAINTECGKQEEFRLESGAAAIRSDHKKETAAAKIRPEKKPAMIVRSVKKEPASNIKIDRANMRKLVRETSMSLGNK